MKYELFNLRIYNFSFKKFNYQFDTPKTLFFIYSFCHMNDYQCFLKFHLICLMCWSIALPFCFKNYERSHKDVLLNLEICGCIMLILMPQGIHFCIGLGRSQGSAFLMLNWQNTYYATKLVASSNQRQDLC